MLSQHYARQPGQQAPPPVQALEGEQAAQVRASRAQAVAAYLAKAKGVLRP